MLPQCRRGRRTSRAQRDAHRVGQLVNAVLHLLPGHVVEDYVLCYVRHLRRRVCLRPLAAYGRTFWSYALRAARPTGQRTWDAGAPAGACSHACGSSAAAARSRQSYASSRAPAPQCPAYVAVLLHAVHARAPAHACSHMQNMMQCSSAPNASPAAARLEPWCAPRSSLQVPFARV